MPPFLWGKLMISGHHGVSRNVEPLEIPGNPKTGFSGRVETSPKRGIAKTVVFTQLQSCWLIYLNLVVLYLWYMVDKHLFPYMPYMPLYISQRFHPNTTTPLQSIYMYLDEHSVYPTFAIHLSCLDEFLDKIFFLG